MSYNCPNAYSYDQNDRYLYRIHFLERSFVLLGNSNCAATVLIGCPIKDETNVGPNFSLMQLHGRSRSVGSVFEWVNNCSTSGRLSLLNGNAGVSLKPHACSGHNIDTAAPYWNLDCLAHTRDLQVNLPDVIGYWGSNKSSILFGDILITGTGS
jgi:hypothetical protein